MHDLLNELPQNSSFSSSSMDLNWTNASPGQSLRDFSPNFECWSLQSNSSTPRRQLPPLPPLPREVNGAQGSSGSGSTNPLGTNPTSSVPTQNQNPARDPILNRPPRARRRRSRNRQR